MSAQTTLQTKLSISVQDKKVVDILKDIRIIIGVKFSYNSTIIPTNARASISAINLPLNTILKQLFGDLNIQYKLVNNQVVLYKRKNRGAVVFEVKNVGEGLKSDKKDEKPTVKPQSNSILYDTVFSIVYDTVITTEYDTVFFTDTVVYVDTIQYIDTIYIEKQSNSKMQYAVELSGGYLMALYSEFTENTATNLATRKAIQSITSPLGVQHVGVLFQAQKYNFVFGTGVQFSQCVDNLNYTISSSEIDSSAYYSYFEKKEMYTEVVASYVINGKLVEFTQEKERYVTDSLLKYDVDTTVATSKHAHLQRISYIGVPIRIGYSGFAIAKFHFGISAGITIHYLINNTLPKDVEYITSSDYALLYLDVNADCFAEYAVTKSIDILLKAQYQRSLNSMYNISNLQVERINNNIGVALAVKFRL